MKKFIFMFLLVIAACLTINVNAATVPYRWVSDGKDVTEESTATIEKDGKVVTLKLNNYDGYGLDLECYGTGQTGIKFIIELTGVNTIHSNDIGINFNYSEGKIEFTGDGSLSIIAKKPISYENFSGSAYIEPSKNIYGGDEPTKKPSEEVKEDQKEIATGEGDSKKLPATSKSVTDKKDTDSKNDNTILYIVFGAFAVLAVGIIIFLLIKLSKKKEA